MAPIVFSITLKVAPFPKKRERNKVRLCWLALLDSQPRLGLKGQRRLRRTEERRRRGERSSGFTRRWLSRMFTYGDPYRLSPQIRTEPEFSSVRQTVRYQVATVTVQTDSVVLCLPLVTVSVSSPAFIGAEQTVFLGLNTDS